MTLTNAILLALDRIQYNDEYIAMVSKYDKENPDTSKIQMVHEYRGLRFR